MLHLLAALRKRWGFHYDAALLLALGLCGAFAVAREAAPVAATERPGAAAVEAPAGVSFNAPDATAAAEVWPRTARFERLAEIGRGKGRLQPGLQRARETALLRAINTGSTPSARGE